MLVMKLGIKQGSLCTCTHVHQLAEHVGGMLVSRCAPSVMEQYTHNMILYESVCDYKMIMYVQV